MNEPEKKNRLRTWLSSLGMRLAEDLPVWPQVEVTSEVRGPLVQLLDDLLRQRLSADEFLQRWILLPTDDLLSLEPLRQLVERYIRIRDDSVSWASGICLDDGMARLYRQAIRMGIDRLKAQQEWDERQTPGRGVGSAPEERRAADS